MHPRDRFASMRRTSFLVTLFLLATFSVSLAQARRPPPPPQPTFQWDSRGWTMLGEQAVSGRVDRDRITVGRYEGRFSKLTLVVLDSDLELMDFTINFADGTKYAPRVQHYFRENARTRVLDLPPNGGIINRIDLKYRNLPGGGRARVQVWGFKVGDVPVPVRYFDEASSINFKNSAIYATKTLWTFAQWYGHRVGIKNHLFEP